MLHVLSLAVDEPALPYPLHAVPGTSEEATAVGGCACGHGRPAHRHYRRGSDCSLCWCGRFAPPLPERLRLRG